MTARRMFLWSLLCCVVLFILSDGQARAACIANCGGQDLTPTATPDFASVGILGANGQKVEVLHCSEVVNLSSTSTNVFTTTLTTGCFIPASAMVLNVPVYLVRQPGGTPTMTVAATTSGTFFQTGTSIATTTGNSDPGNKPGPASYNGVAAQSVTLTLSANPSDTVGQVRVDIFYYLNTPATS